MSVTLHGAHLAGASALATSLQLGAASAASLDPAIGVIDGSESSYAPAKAPLFFSAEGGGGGGASSSMTMPGPLAQNIDMSSTDTSIVDIQNTDGRANPKLFMARDLLGLDDTMTAMGIAQRLWKSDVTYDIWKYQTIFYNEATMGDRDDYHRIFDLLDTLLDDENANIALQSMLTISQYLMSSDLAEAIYPGSNMTYRGKFFLRTSEVWNRSRPIATQNTTPYMELVRSFGTNKDGFSPILSSKLYEISISQDEDEFASLIDAISTEVQSHDENRSESAAIAFVLSARLVEKPSRLHLLTMAFLFHVNKIAALFRDKAGLWTPMEAIIKAAILLAKDDKEERTEGPAMFQEFINTVVDMSPNADAAPAVFHLAAHLEDKEHVEMLARAIHRSESNESIHMKHVKHILNYGWKFTTAEQAITNKAAEALELKG